MMPHSVRIDRTRQEYGRQLRKPVYEYLLALMNGATHRQLAKIEGVHNSSFSNIFSRREIPADERFFKWMRGLTDEQRERYRIALDVEKMQHPEAVDYVNGD